MRNSAVIETDRLSKHYRAAAALSEVTVSVEPYSICGFLGPNGAGKTTFIRLLLGLARPSAGRARVLGYDITRDSLAIRQRVGYLSQQPSYYGEMTARQTLQFALSLFSRESHREQQRRMGDMLDLVGLASKADRLVRQLSGGERQRLGIAQAQIHQPELLILDEPAAALDPAGRRDVLEIMRSLRQRTTIFYSTHILDDVQRISDSVIILDRGRLVRQSSIAELLLSSTSTFTAVLRGNTETAEMRLRRQSWVTDVQRTMTNGTASLVIKVADEEAAANQLVNIITADGDTVVMSLARHQEQLEDVFMRLTHEANNG